MKNPRKCKTEMIQIVTCMVILFITYSGCQFTLESKKTTKPIIKPNIVLINCDDLGYGDLSLTGAIGYTTPHIDQLARDGIFFTNYYSPQAVCSASRAGLLTGCYPNRIGFSGALDHSAKRGINPDEETLAELLKANGYKTAIYGKWHLGHHEKFLPTKHGFDDFLGIPYSNDMWPNHPQTPNYYPPLPLIKNTETIELNPDQSHFTKTFTERTVQFIEQNKDQPFFVYLAHPMPHVPIFASSQFEGSTEHGLFGDVISEIDWSIGKIKETLETLKLSENTIIMFTSDNGPWLNYGNHAGTSGGFREGKGTTYEGGQRVPFIVSWPGHIPKGEVSNALIAGIDILPTVVDMTNSPMPKAKIDGLSFKTLFLEDPNKEIREQFLFYYRKNNLEAIRYKNWKLVFEHKGRTYKNFQPGQDGIPGQSNEWNNEPQALYNLARDFGEQYDVSESYPEVVTQLQELANQARYDLGDDLQQINGTGIRKIGKVE